MSVARSRAGLAGWLLLLLSILADGRVAAADPVPPARGSRKSAVEQQLAQAEARLAAGELAAALKAAEAAYRGDPRSEALLLLGKIALRGGQALAGRDLLQRVLSDPDSGPLLAEAQRLLDEAAPITGGSAEVVVIGPRGALVFVDGELRGSLPLLSPVLVAPGARAIELELGKKRLTGNLKVEPDRHSEARFDFSAGSVVVSWPPSVVLLYAQPLSPQSRKAALILEQTLRKDGLALLGRETALRRHSTVASCLTERRCQLELITRNEAEGLVFVELSAPPTGSAEATKLRMSWLDPTVGEISAAVSTSCESCTAERLTADIETAVRRLLAGGRSRQSGALELVITPTGAEVLLDGKLLKSPPSRQALFAGQHELVVRAPGHTQQLETVNIEAGKTLQRRVDLTPQKPVQPVQPVLTTPAPPAAGPVYRTRMRSRGALIAGVLAIGAGSVVTGFGVSGLLVAGRCAPEPPPGLAACRQFYDSTTPATAMLSVGIGVTVGGIVAAAVGGSPVRVPVGAP